MNRRDHQTFVDLGEIGILYQYLWMDDKHSVTFNNSLADLTIRMKDNKFIVVKNGNFPELDETSYMDMLYPENLIGIIDYLKNVPSQLNGYGFRSKWEEIKIIVNSSIALTNFNRRR